ncbi:cyclic diguanylate phosphodiesterase [Enterobacter ludwigii]|uniref:cyclic diguanylate phosphodiesterase n=1 Tax=Enterobacter ludwigii TaxID=299767 RepID=UPI002B4BF6E5|nr:cyclic diguanylate phosphodiesterase [Enterobacter ludwigii]WRM04111.1 cyclic diguanylate phosphodiesterase [Enterobacter ludwigii]
MKRSPAYHPPLLLAFFLLVMSAGTALCYLKIRQSLDEDIEARLKQAITSLDITLGHARLAAGRAQEYLGQDCSRDVLTGIRTLVATLPDVRTVNLARHNTIYCTSVFGGKTFSLNMTDYPDGSLNLMGGNRVTPSRSLLVYTRRDQRNNSVLIGIDGYYIYNVLRVLDGGAHLYLKVGERYMDSHGQVSATPEISIPVKRSSRQFGYSVLADRAALSGVSASIRYGRDMFIAVLVVSLLLTVLFRHYLASRSTLEFMLRQAIKHKQLQPFIQPIVAGEEGRIVGGEVLVRWEHPELGFIPPDKFIAVAEHTGLIGHITDVCFSDVMRQLHQTESILPEGLFICFNVSAATFQDDHIVSLCTRFLSRVKGMNARVVLEITERGAVENTLQTKTVTRKLKQLGVLFSLDDFGTGHANYSYLQQFMPEFLKVDKVFTSDAGTNEASRQVVKNMVSLARKFNCTIIAEGVENRGQLQVLKALGIDRFQGYYFSRAVSVADYIRLCAVAVEKVEAERMSERDRARKK